MVGTRNARYTVPLTTVYVIPSDVVRFYAWAPRTICALGVTMHFVDVPSGNDTVSVRTEHIAYIRWGHLPTIVMVSGQTIECDCDPVELGQVLEGHGVFFHDTLVGGMNE